MRQEANFKADGFVSPQEWRQLRNELAALRDEVERMMRNDRRSRSYARFRGLSFGAFWKSNGTGFQSSVPVQPLIPSSKTWLVMPTVSVQM